MEFVKFKALKYLSYKLSSDCSRKDFTQRVLKGGHLHLLFAAKIRSKPELR